MLSFKSFLLESSAVPEGSHIHGYLSFLCSPVEPDSEELHEATLINKVGEYSSSAQRGLQLPRVGSMIEKGNQQFSELGNLHKHIHAGLEKTFNLMAVETPEAKKAAIKVSRSTFHEFGKERGFSSKLDLMGGNMKTEKSSGEGVSTLGLSLAPHTLSGLNGFDVCPSASGECRANCLGTEAGGNRTYPSSLEGKVLRTHFLVAHPDHFARILDSEISRHTKDATAAGMLPGVRLNILSDMDWKKHKALFAAHPAVQFYDYTKVANRVGHQSLAPNYHLTLSHTGTGHAESNDKAVAKKLGDGHVVAMVYARGKIPPTHAQDMTSGNKYPVVDGDHDDNTFDRHTASGLIGGVAGHGVVSGLKLKGVTAESAGGFCNKVDGDGIIRFNHPK